MRVRRIPKERGPCGPHTVKVCRSFRVATAHLAKYVGADKTICRASTLLLVPADEPRRVLFLNRAASRQHHLHGHASRQTLHETPDNALVRARTVVAGLALAVVHEPFDKDDVGLAGHHVAFEAEYAKPRSGSADRRIDELETRVRIAILKPAPDQRPP